MLIKIYQEPQDSDKRYSPGEIVTALSIPVTGNPKAHLISTSHYFGTAILASPARTGRRLRCCPRSHRPRIPCWNSRYVASVTSSKLEKPALSNRSHFASNMTLPLEGETWMKKVRSACST